MPGRDAPLNLHASCVALDGKGVLICGASGSGKSSLALRLMALGARLVADDRTDLRRDGGRLLASAPGSISGLIEARGVGLLRAEPEAFAPVVLVVDRDATETQRLPRLHRRDILSVTLPVLHKIEAPHFPAAILQYLKAGRQEPR